MPRPTRNRSGGTRLSLEHAGFGPVNGFAFDAMDKGWRGKVGARLTEVIAQAA
jgi:hypothetical protein